ncbi:MAG: AAA family ATPase [Pseudomonadota bacterium]
MVQAYGFIRRLAGDDTATLCFQTFDDSKEKPLELTFQGHGTLEALKGKLTELNRKGAGISVTVNETDGKGRTAENITAVRALFLDLDGAPIEPVRDSACPPDLVVQTSKGPPARYHCYWFLKDVELNEFTGIQRALAERFDGDPSVKDLPRVMRLPGFYHRKKEPFLVEILEAREGPHYSKDDLISGLGLTIESPQTVPRAEVVSASTRVTQGTRHNHLKTLAAKLRNTGISREGLSQGLLGENGSVCYPPLQDSEVETIAKWVLTKDGAGGYVPPETITVKDLLSKDFPQMKWIVGNIIPPGLTLLSGKQKLGKSWLALSIACSVAYGETAIGRFETSKCGVLFIGLEDSERRLAERIRMLGFNNGIDSIRVATDWLPLDRGGLEAIEKDIVSSNTRFVVIDTVPRIRSDRRGRDSYAHDYADFGALQNLAQRYDVGVLGLTHTRKLKADDPFDAISGTRGVSGAADTTVVMNKAGDGATIHIEGRDVEPGLYRLRRDGPRWVVSDEAPARNACVQAVETRGRATTAEVAQLIGKGREATKKALQRAKADGLVRSPQDGVWEMVKNGVPVSR